MPALGHLLSRWKGSGERVLGFGSPYDPRAFLMYLVRGCGCAFIVVLLCIVLCFCIPCLLALVCSDLSVVDWQAM